jgi:hypothetical protein
MSNQVYYATPSQFNDPIDCRYSINIAGLDESSCRPMAKETMHFLAKNIREDNRLFDGLSLHDLTHINTMDVFGGNCPTELIIRKIEHLICHLQEKSGLLCLGLSWNNYLLWSYYAEDHRGYCVEYDLRYIKCDGLEHFNVNYGSADVTIQSIHEVMINNYGNWYFKLINLLRRAKFKPWEHENEYRISVSGHTGLQDSPMSQSAIYFGSGMENWTKHIIINSVRNRKSTKRIKFYNTNIERSGIITRSIIKNTEIDSYKPRDHSENEWDDILQ